MKISASRSLADRSRALVAAVTLAALFIVAREVANADDPATPTPHPQPPIPNAARADDLVPLEYNNPGLVVDLGVGLWAWPVPCDADGDGDYDLIVSCPDKPSNGVWLFENTTGDTAQNKFPVFQPPRPLSRTVHYVLPSYVDGRLRVLSPGFEYPDFAHRGLTEKRSLGAPKTVHTPRGNAPGVRNKIRHNEWRYADYDGDGQWDLIVGIEDWSDYGWDDAWDVRGRWKNGPLHGFVYWLRNTGTSAEPRYAEAALVAADGKPLDTFGCPTPNFADFDGDGDLDLLCGEFLDGFTYFENTGTRTRPRYAAGRRLRAPDGAPLAMDLEMIVPVAFDWDRDGDLDLVVGNEDGRVALVENTGGLWDDRTPRFELPRYFQQQAGLLKCGALATPVGFDWDGDGDVDILSGNTAGYIEWFENQSGPGAASPQWAAPRRLEAGGKVFRVMAGPNGSIQGPCEAKWGYTTLSVADWDGDELPDVVFNSIWGKVEWLCNVGTRGKPKLAAPQPIKVEWPGTVPKPAWTWWTPEAGELVTQWRTTPVVYDVTGDGLVDLAMLDREGYLALFERARRGESLVVLPPRRVFVDESGAPLRLNAGTAGRSGRRKLCIVDWNGDGRFDFLLNSANAELLEQVEARDGKWFFRRAGPIARRNIEGHDVSPTVVDFDADGIPDFLGGAEDGHLYFLANPRGTRPAATR
jgi:FG-GAP-like repeat